MRRWIECARGAAGDTGCSGARKALFLLASPQVSGGFGGATCGSPQVGVLGGQRVDPLKWGFWGGNVGIPSSGGFGWATCGSPRPRASPPPLLQVESSSGRKTQPVGFPGFSSPLLPGRVHNPRWCPPSQANLGRARDYAIHMVCVCVCVGRVHHHHRDGF